MVTVVTVTMFLSTLATYYIMTINGVFLFT